MSQYAFGAGVLWGTPLADATGAAIAVPTPVNFGALQDINLDVSFNSKELYGSKQFPLAVGRGVGKIALKAKSAQISGALLNNIFFGQTLSSGIRTDVQDVTGVAIPSTPFTITVTPPSSGTYGYDLGVADQNGVPMTKVAAGPATGQYSQSGAVYTFAAADTGLKAFISYNYIATSTTAKKQTVVNQTLGYQPSFQADLVVPYNSKILTVKLYNCISTKLGFATKLEDFMIPDFEAMAFADQSGNVMDWSVSE